MIARHISMEGGLFLIVLLVLILVMENPLVDMLRKIIKRNDKIIPIIDLCILAFLARGITMFIWNIFYN